MAASNSPRPPSPSDSDSDREPNSHGARVFWGNLKTPEKSRSAFVDPPQTVVRTQRVLHIQSPQNPTEFSTSIRDNNLPSLDPLQMVEKCDEPLDPTGSGSNNQIMTEVAYAQEQHDGPLPDVPESSNFGNNSVYASSAPSSPHVMSPQLGPTKMPSQESGSEAELELDPALQPSYTPSPLNLYAGETFEAIGQLSTQTPLTPFTESTTIAEPYGSPPSMLPDLISFDMPTPPQSSMSQLQSHTSPLPSLTQPSHLSSTSSATVDDLLTHSPLQSKSPLLQPQVLETQPNIFGQEAIVTGSLPTIEPVLSHQMIDSVKIEACLSEIPVDTNPARVQTPSPTPSNNLDQEVVVAASVSTCEPQAEIAKKTVPSVRIQTSSHSAIPSANAIDATPFQVDTTTNNSGDLRTDIPSSAQDGPATAGLHDLDAMTSPKSRRTMSFPSPSRGETRKRSPMKTSKGKEKAHDGDNGSNQLSNDMSGESLPSLGNDEGANDKAAKRERRSKARREAEYRRQQLLSLSPASANVLSILASPEPPDRDSPIRTIGLDKVVSNFAVNPDHLNRSTSAEPETPRKNAARRVPISSLSPRRRSMGSPLRFIVPGPINLDDPNRTPARRVPLPPGFQTPRLFPLDDPERTPARRVPIHSSTRPADLPDHPAPLMQVEESSPIKQPNSSELRERTVSLSPRNDVSIPLPFPIRQNVAGGTTGATSVRPSRLDMAGTAKPQLASNLRQFSSISTSKIARISSKPYSRPTGTQGSSRLPVTSFIRSQVTIPGASSSSTATNVGAGRPNPVSANLMPTRIPSPSKRSASQAKPIDSSSSTPASASVDVNNAEDNAHGVTAYKRKRQRMVSEGDPDEPPAKRAVIMVRPVIKGMYNKSSKNSNASGSTMIQRESSPLQPPRPLGPIQVRPVIPGTLRHFETTRSSSRDLLNSSEQDINSDNQPTSPGLLDTGLEMLGDRERSPSADTVTSLSPEPTPETSHPISVPRSETQTSTESGPELRRTTRARKPHGPDGLGLPSTSTAIYTRKLTPLTRTISMIQGDEGLCAKGSTRSTTRTGAPQEGLPLNPRQLQALTEANTIRNQTCLADLERKVVRRYGPRPASPSTRVRTMNQKSKEERSKEREERAERRRRREQGSNVTASSDGDYTDAPSSPSPDKQLSENDPLAKHSRGPGDEEDYETPARPPTSQGGQSKTGKTVKWDRGLARTISDWAAEQLAKKANEAAKAEAIRKGCLVRDRTTLRLDPLGNVPDADEPLKDLGRERIIVTRFVYDDDLEVARIKKKKG